MKIVISFVVCSKTSLKENNMEADILYACHQVS